MLRSAHGSRRHFLQTLHAAGAFWASRCLGDDSPDVHVETGVYKRADGLDLQADVVWRGRPQTRPAAVWIHGGALIMGSRRWIDGQVQQRLLNAGHAIVSIDYRLAPETKLPEIVQDVQDALHWIRHEAPQRFPIDARRLAAIGGSAGGYRR
jgi:acetyl esterase/lipase